MLRRAPSRARRCSLDLRMRAALHKRRAPGFAFIVRPVRRKGQIDRSRAPSFGSLKRPSPWDNEDPIREELFSVERLEDHARSLALAQTVSARSSKGNPLARQLASNGAALLVAYRSIVRAINEGRAITSAAEWLVDNYYLVERQIRELRADLPPGYYRQLPKLDSGPFRGLPARVWPDLGLRRSHRQQLRLRDAGALRSRLSERAAADDRRTLGDLDHVANRPGREPRAARPNKSRSISRPGKRRTRWRIACWAPAGGRPRASARVLQSLERLPISEALAVQLVHRLRDQDPKITPALTWLDQRLGLQQTTTETAVRDVHRRQGATNVTVRNIIASLRLINGRRLAPVVRARQSGR